MLKHSDLDLVTADLGNIALWNAEEPAARVVNCALLVDHNIRD